MELKEEGREEEWEEERKDGVRARVSERGRGERKTGRGRGRRRRRKLVDINEKRPALSGRATSFCLCRPKA